MGDNRPGIVLVLIADAHQGRIAAKESTIKR
jgi:hypothetical protein